MAFATFKVEVLTPEGEVFNDDVELLSTFTSVGSIGIRAHHQPLLAMLDPTELRLYKSESEVVRYAQGEGTKQGPRGSKKDDDAKQDDEQDEQTDETQDDSGEESEE